MVRWQNFFKDKVGHVVIWQTPNLLLLGWAVSHILSSAMSQGHAKTGIGHLGTALLFTWAYLEVTSGASYFRRTLGGIVMIMIVVGSF